MRHLKKPVADEYVNRWSKIMVLVFALALWVWSQCAGKLTFASSRVCAWTDMN
jgi:hypothetical protein